MVRIFEKKSILGVIRKEMRFGLYSVGVIQIFCSVNGKEPIYLGSINADLQHAQALEWKETGFIEIE